MKRYQFFTYSAYYPYGGSGDLHASGDTVEELRESIRNSKQAANREFHEILDMEERRWLSDAEVFEIRNFR